MKPEIKKLWIEALRSGKYKQGINELVTPTATGHCFCALGVLCEVALQHNVPITRVDKGYSYVYKLPDSDETVSSHATGGLPANVAEWAGLTNAWPVIKVGEEECSIIRMNDCLRLSFEEIADKIEKENIT